MAWSLAVVSPATRDLRATVELHENTGGRARRDRGAHASTRRRGESGIDAPVLFDGCRARVDELLDAHADMGAVERTIDDTALGREEKDALWLWARGRRDRLISEGRPWPETRNQGIAVGDGHD